MNNAWLTLMNWHLFALHACKATYNFHWNRFIGYGLTMCGWIRCESCMQKHVYLCISRSCMWFGIAVFWTQLATRTSVAMSRDSGVTSLPSAGWSCASLEQGVQMAAEAAGLDLRTRDFSQAGFSQIILYIYTNRVRMDPQICATWNVLHFQTL